MKRRAFFGIITGFLVAAGLKLGSADQSVGRATEAPVRPLRIPDLEARVERLGRARVELLAEDAACSCDEAVSRREEWLCREMLHREAIL